MKKIIYNVLVVDRSGSMDTIIDSTVTGMNETIKSAQSAQLEFPDQVHLFTLVLFSGGGGGWNDKSVNIETVMLNRPVGSVPMMTRENYRPDGGTPMCDAIGLTINQVEANMVKNLPAGVAESIVIFTIITDGQENTSTRYNQQSVKSLIETKKTQNWTFAFIGANMDSETIGNSMAFNNHMNFKSSAVGTERAFAANANSRSVMYSSLSRGASLDEASLEAQTLYSTAEEQIMNE